MEDEWLTAGGGNETPFVGRDGRTYLYVWNPGRVEHGYLDLGTDIVENDHDWNRRMEYLGGQREENE